MPRVLLLSGPPASGKDTVTAALTALDPRFALFRRIKAGSGRTEGYRIMENAELAKLEERGEIVQRHERYGNVYAVDAPMLRSMSRAGLWPVIHVGRLENLGPLRQATDGTSVLLWADRPTVASRLKARGSTDVDDRLRAWEEERTDLTRSARAADFDLVVDTGSAPPEEAAQRIKAALQHRIDGHAEVDAFLRALRGLDTWN